MSILQENLPLASLLRDSGVQPTSLALISAQKAAQLLAHPGPGEESLPDVDSVLQCMQALLFLLPQVPSDREQDLLQIGNIVVCDIIDPYLTAVSSPAATNRGRLCVHVHTLSAVLGFLLQKTTASVEVVRVFTELLQSLGGVLTVKNTDISADKIKVRDPYTVVTLLGHTLQRAEPSTLEREETRDDGLSGSLSPLFEAALGLLQHSDLRLCYLLAGSTLPLLLLTPAHPERVAEIWQFIVSVHNQSINITSDRSELILVLLCCFSDFFISFNHTSPFSSRFPGKSADSLPAHDLRAEPLFWTIVQEGLISPDPLARKRCMYLVQCVLVSVRGGAGGVVSSSREGGGGVFWWSPECDKELGAVWDDLILILETMEEKQVKMLTLLGPRESVLINEVS